MSDENPPKLRLKPKLAGETPATPQATPAPENPAPVTPAATEAAPAAESPKGIRLRPRLTADPAATAQVAEAAPAPEVVPAEIPPAPAPESEEAPKPKVSLRPRSATPAEAPAPAAVEDPAPAASDAPPPTAPFPPPPATTAKFPPPPVAGKFPPPPGAIPGTAPVPDAGKKDGGESDDKKPKGLKQKLVQYGVVALLVLGALAWKAGKYFLDRTVTTAIDHKLFTKEDPKPQATAPTAPQTPQGQAVDKAKQVVAQNDEHQAAMPAEVAKTDTPPEKAAPDATAVPTPPPETAPVVAKPVTPPPPPPPSAAFKIWVSNLKFSLRAGSRTRILIERTSYDVGDTVNPQLGIMFAGYDDAKNLVLFKDKTGAVVERRY